MKRVGFVTKVAFVAGGVVAATLWAVTAPRAMAVGCTTWPDVMSEITAVSDPGARAMLMSLLADMQAAQASNDCGTYNAKFEMFMNMQMMYSVSGVLTGPESDAIGQCIVTTVDAQNSCGLNDVVIAKSGSGNTEYPTTQCDSTDTKTCRGTNLTKTCIQSDWGYDTVTKKYAHHMCWYKN